MPIRANLEGATAEEERRVIESVRFVKNFPKPGLDFKDLSMLLGQPDAFQTVVTSFVNRYRSRGITAVAGIECRGFIFAAPVALGLQVPFVPFRKPGKLPCKSVGVEFRLGPGSKGTTSACFGKDRLEMHEDAFQPGAKVLIIDDMLGTGSTLAGACELVEKGNSSVVECACVCELAALRGRETLAGRSVFVLLEDHNTPAS